MAKIPINDPLMHALNNADNKRTFPRGYSGLSAIGSKCHRYLQFCHYWAFQTATNVRVQRIFDFGHLSEEFMVRDLQKVGYEFHSDQLEIIATAGHWKGHIDGILEKDGAKLLAEFKTHNDKSFAELKKKKVKLAKPTHYAQCQSYMGYLDLKLALYMAYNKNTSEYYVEFIEFDPECFAELKRKEMEILTAESMLPRIGNGLITWFECKFCDAKYTCFGKQEVPKNCRTCKYVDVEDKGVWACSKQDGIGLSKFNQVKACDQYKLDPMFKDLD